MSGATYDEAVAYAETLMEPVSIMYGKTSWTQENAAYHVIRAFGVEHWKQHMEEVAVGTPRLEIRRIE